MWQSKVKFPALVRRTPPSFLSTFIGVCSNYKCFHKTWMPSQSYDGHRINFWPQVGPWSYHTGHQSTQTKLTLGNKQPDSQTNRRTRANLYAAPPNSSGGMKGFQTIFLPTFVHLGFDGGHAGVISPGPLGLECREHPPHLVKLLVHLHEFLMHRMETLVTSGRN